MMEWSMTDFDFETRQQSDNIIFFTEPGNDMIWNWVTGTFTYNRVIFSPQYIQWNGIPCPSI